MPIKTGPPRKKTPVPCKVCGSGVHHNIFECVKLLKTELASVKSELEQLRQEVDGFNLGSLKSDFEELQRKIDNLDLTYQLRDLQNQIADLNRKLDK